MAKERESPRRALGEPGKRTGCRASETSKHERAIFLLPVTHLTSNIPLLNRKTDSCGLKIREQTFAMTFYIFHLARNKINSFLSLGSLGFAFCSIWFSPFLNIFFVTSAVFNPVLAASRFLIEWFDYSMNLAQWLLLSVFLAFAENTRARTILLVRSREVDFLYDLSIQL